MVEKVQLVTLNNEQIARAKKENGERKQISHAVVCGEYGQLFGTEMFCRKYFSAWCEIFPHLFSGGEEVTTVELSRLKSTPDLVMKLIKANDRLEKAAQQEVHSQSIPSKSCKGAKRANWIAKLFGLTRT